eukprot:SAG22_NODE_21707_length_254_cov_1.658065_1_plen_84_part_11
MKPISAMLESDELDAAEAAAITAMVWHAGILEPQDVTEPDRLLELSAAVENIVQDARQIRNMLFQQRMRGESSGKGGDGGGWDQ